MKKNIKLNKLAKNAMKEKEMSHVRGGSTWCGCGCIGPSGIYANRDANHEHGWWSRGISRDEQYLRFD
ncbi:MAG: TIGR04149 family rSAM-modified RiPP [Prevotellaceae bacterium]|jgi:natural product precursor|nr:TIGR04149 family rSAM-modified RiPP [Prevotellaceae bacterium]